MTMAMSAVMRTMMPRQGLLLKPLASAARWLSRQKQLARQGLLLPLWPYWFSEKGRSLPSSAISDSYLPYLPLQTMPKRCTPREAQHSSEPKQLRRRNHTGLMTIMEGSWMAVGGMA